MLLKATAILVGGTRCTLVLVTIACMRAPWLPADPTAACG